MTRRERLDRVRTRPARRASGRSARILSRNVRGAAAKNVEVSSPFQQERDTDSGQFILHVRARTGTRIEETARVADLVEAAIRREIPAAEVDAILDNIGLPYSSINWMHSSSGFIGAGDADILVSLKPDHRPTADYVRTLRRKLPGEFPGTTFYFLPADIVTQILNFGLPAPIDIHIAGADVESNRRVADQMLNELRQVATATRTTDANTLTVIACSW
jgi:multidrug efflux pump subunit AcrB